MKAEIIIASDTHGRNEVLHQLEQAYPKADLFVHCGDLEDYASDYPHWVFVRGNNDLDYDMPDSRIINIAGVRMYITHSHHFGYYDREHRLAAQGRRENCQVVIYGHTHVPQAEKVDGIWLINPGSMTFPRDGNTPCYAKMIIEDDGSIHVDLIHQEDWPFTIEPKTRRKKGFTFWK